ncbi:MAG TPA: Nramp family divalent metal transporter [Microbacterium sp.]|nr:Nramp family divalent metal transporter [Microbacterium sp.]
MTSGSRDLNERESGEQVAAAFPTKVLPAPKVRDLPDPPAKAWRYVGPGIIAAGVGLSTGEFVLFPYIASQVGLTFVWAALVGLLTQFFINMEIERYTLATGETAITGFSRLWRHWGLVFVIGACLANVWPAWATSSATLVTYAFGGDVAIIAIVMLLAIAAILTLAPVVYTALERIELVKVGAVLLLVIVAAIFAIGPAWADAPQIVTQPGFPAAELGIAVLMGALAFAGAGGGQNLVQSNWIRDKGFGMGRYIPRLASPITGGKATRGVEAHGVAGYVFPPTEANLGRWKGWWRFANREQLLTFVLISLISIVFMSLLSYATTFGRDDVENDISFLQVEGTVLMETVGPWFGYFFWIIGAFALFAAATGIVDYTARLAADVLHTSYFTKAPEGRIYAIVVWSLALLGCVVIGVGFDQPIVLTVIAACVGGTMMFIYSGLLIIINRRMLPAAIRIRGLRLAMLVWAILLFGTLAVLTIQDQLSKAFAG